MAISIGTRLAADRKPPLTTAKHELISQAWQGSTLRRMANCSPTGPSVNFPPRFRQDRACALAKHDKYDRTLGDMNIGEMWIDRVMIERGVAWASQPPAIKELRKSALLQGFCKRRSASPP